jgi:hypothetical protein
MLPRGPHGHYRRYRDVDGRDHYPVTKRRSRALRSGSGYAPQPGLARRFLKLELIAKITTAGLKTDDLEIPESVLVHRKRKFSKRNRRGPPSSRPSRRQYPNAAVYIISIGVPHTQVSRRRSRYDATYLRANLPHRFRAARSQSTGPLTLRLVRTVAGSATDRNLS